MPPTRRLLPLKLGPACLLEAELHAEVRGGDPLTCFPMTVVTSSAAIREAFGGQVAAIVGAVKVTFDKTPPELAADIMEQGIVLTGGGALRPSAADNPASALFQPARTGPRACTRRRKGGDCDAVNLPPAPTRSVGVENHT